MIDSATQADAALIDLIRARDVEAFETLRLRYHRLLLRHIQSIVHSPEAADDLLQETLLRIWTRAEQWDGRGSVRGWLFRIATNLALNWLRSAGRRKETPLDRSLPAQDEDLYAPDWMIDWDAPDPLTALEDAERLAMLREMVEGLPEEKRELIRMVYEAEMEVKDAAQVLGIPEGTAKSRLHYSTRYLARKWKDQENEQS